MIRDALENDLEQVLAINQRNLPHVSALSRPELDSLYRQAVYCRIVEEEGKIAAFLLGLNEDADYQSPNYQWFKQRYDSFFYVDRVAVDAWAQRRGYGSLLYEDVERFAKTNALPLVTCEVNIRPKNEGSLKFHEARKFEPVGTQDTENGKKTVSLMIKRVC